MTLYDLLLRAYPRVVRERFGAGMRAAFAADYARARRRGSGAAAVFVIRTCIGTIGAALAARLPRPAALRSFVSTDLRDALRSLLGTPLVTTVAVMSLALGIGANTALYSILYSLVLKPLPVAEPERLALLAGHGWTNPIWEQIRDRRHLLFEDACAWSSTRFNLTSSGRVDPVDGGYVSGSLFETLGVSTVLGRPLSVTDDIRGGGGQGFAAVVSHRFWQGRLGGRPDVLGRRLTANGVPFTIVGVAPPGFLGPEVGYAMDLFVPLAAEGAIRGPESTLDGRSSWWLEIMVRLEAGQSPAAAAAGLNAARGAIRDATVPLDADADRRARYLQSDLELTPAATGVSSLRDRFAQPLTIIMVVVAAVLLIACANIANLMLARAASRRQELSVRLALGASRLRLGAQLFVESLLLGVAGGLAGLAVAHGAARMLVAQFGSGAATLDVSIDLQVLAFTSGVALAATVLFGTAPAIGLRDVQPGEVLKEGSRSVTGDGRRTTRHVLVVVQVALSFALIGGAGLFVRSFATLAATPLGFDPDGLLIASIDARQSRVAPADRAPFYQRIADAVAASPGVSHASVSSLTPMSGRGWNNRVEVPGGPVLAARERVTWLNAVAPGWFETYRMQRRAGRDFTPADTHGGEPVAIVNEAFVRRFVGAASPIGMRIKALGSPMPDTTIVGVVNDALYRSPRAGHPPTMYVPVAQAGVLASEFAVTIRAGSPRGALERTVADAVGRVDGALSLSFRDYSEQVAVTVAQERLVAILSAVFAALALLLASLGIYGVTAYAIARRRRELAVRMALGASAVRVTGLVLGRVLLLLMVGTGIGIALLLWGARFARTLLFDVAPGDPLMLAAAAVFLSVVGLFAGWLPLRKVHSDRTWAHIR